MNGKKYIGQTTKSLSQRMVTHFSKHSRCARLKSAIEYHGKENFEISVIETMLCPVVDILAYELNEAESRWIKVIDTMHPNGYNLTSGGDKPRKSKESVDRAAQKHRKAVRRLETGQTWESVSECAEFFGVKVKQVSRILRGERKRLKWSYTLAYLQQS